MSPLLKQILTLGIPLLVDVISTKWRERQERKQLEALRKEQIADGQRVAQEEIAKMKREESLSRADRETPRKFFGGQK